MIKRFTFAISVLYSAVCCATEQYGVTIEKLNVNREAQMVFVRTSQTPLANGCHTDTNWSFTFLLSSDADKATYSTLLAAKLAEKNVDIVGYGTCPSGGGTIEELRWLTIPS